MTFTSRNAAKGAAAFSLAMLLALPALTGCSMDKPQADDMGPEATQSQNVATDQAEPKAGVKTPAVKNATTDAKTDAKASAKSSAKSSTKKAAVKTAPKASTKGAAAQKSATKK